MHDFDFSKAKGIFNSGKLVDYYEGEDVIDENEGLHIYKKKEMKPNTFGEMNDNLEYIYEQRKKRNLEKEENLKEKKRLLEEKKARRRHEDVDGDKNNKDLPSKQVKFDSIDERKKKKHKYSQLYKLTSQFIFKFLISKFIIN